MLIFLLFSQVTDTVGITDTSKVIYRPDIALIEDLADSLFVMGEFNSAALEYKRAEYLDIFDTSYSCDTIMLKTKLSLALYRNGEQNAADSILYDMDGPVVRMVRAVLLIEEDNPYLAARAVNAETRQALGAPAYRLRGWAYLEANDFASASEEFRLAGDTVLASTVAVLTKEHKTLRLKNPRTARWLSVVIPGLGEAYAGRPLFGLWALLVNAGDTYLIVNAIFKKNYVDALLVYTFLWQRFWAGSMANASRFAMEWNERKIAEILDPIRTDFDQADALRLDLTALNKLYELQQNNLVE